MERQLILLLLLIALIYPADALTDGSLLQTAINAVPPGQSSTLVLDGTAFHLPGPATVRGDITLLGRGASAVEITSDADPVFTVTTGTLTLVGVTVRNTDGDAIQVDVPGTLHLANAAVEGFGAAVRSRGSVTIDYSTLTGLPGDGSSDALRIGHPHARTVIRNSTIAGATDRGIQVGQLPGGPNTLDGGGIIELTNVTIANADDDGLFLNGTGILNHVTIHNVGLSEGSTVELANDQSRLIINRSLLGPGSCISIGAEVTGVENQSYSTSCPPNFPDADFATLDPELGELVDLGGPTRVFAPTEPVQSSLVCPGADQRGVVTDVGSCLLGAVNASGSTETTVRLTDGAVPALRVETSGTIAGEFTVYLRGAEPVVLSCAPCTGSTDFAIPSAALSDNPEIVAVSGPVG